MKITETKIKAVHDIVDTMFFDGVNLTIAQLAAHVGLSKFATNKIFNARFEHNRALMANVKSNDYPAQLMECRREVINGKVCHVYPSRMNF